jgi:hypothetical protein
VGANAPAWKHKVDLVGDESFFSICAHAAPAPALM